MIKQTSPYITHGRWTIGGRCQSAERPPLFPYNISTWKYISRPFFQNVWRDWLTPTPKNSATFIKILFLPEREKNISFQITVYISLLILACPANVGISQSPSYNTVDSCWLSSYDGRQINIKGIDHLLFVGVHKPTLLHKSVRFCDILHDQFTSSTAVKQKAKRYFY